MRKKVWIVGIVSAAILVLVLIGAIYVYFAPSNKQREMSQQYSELAEDERMIVVGNKILDEHAIDLEKKTYLPIQTVQEFFNKRFYWDNKENILTYVLPDKIIKVEPNKKNYLSGISEEKVDYDILIKKNKSVYVALEFLRIFTNRELQTYENPRRIVSKGNSADSYTIAVLKNSTRLRVGPGKKYDYLLKLEKEQEVFVEPESVEENGYKKVMTLEGIKGYILQKDISKETKKNYPEDDSLPVFEQTKSGGQVCLAWHQVTNISSNAYLSNVVAEADSLNVVSPTWFSLSDHKGNFTSLANEAYVQSAHNRGLKVWALIDDFNKKVKLERLLGRTSTRQKLINELVGKAIQYNIDGINIDFERVTSKSADAFLQFLRELSIKCRSNQLILSVDNYVPASHNKHYDLEEQGKVVDYLIFMGYDEHYAGSEKAGSVSSINFIKSALENVIASVPKERAVMALPFYTRLWCETKSSKGLKVTSQAYGMDTSKEVLRQNGAMATWDETTQQYYSEYKNEKKTYKIWLEEEKSLTQKLLAVKEKQFAGVAFWKLGFERVEIWSIIAQNIQ